MSTPQPPPDDPLDLAARALHERPIPDGPPDETVARTLAALADATQRPNVYPFRFPWRLTMGLVLKAAAAVITLAGGLFYLVGNPSSATLVAFAETAQKLQMAHTIDYRITVRMPGQKEPMTGREYYKDPGLSRTEMGQPQPVTTISDTPRGKLLSLAPATKVAILQNWKINDEDRQRVQNRALSTIDHLRTLAGKEGRPVGKRRVGDVDTQGVRVELEGHDWTVWIDPARKLPVLAEATIRMQGKEIAVTMSDFRIDPELDDALFRLDVPEGYTVQKIDQPIPLREEALVIVLRAYAEGAGGAFPDRLDDAAAYQKAFAKDKPKDPADPKVIRVAQSMAASIVFLQFELKDKYHYQPQGVKLGDADKLLFWYKREGADRYRAIYGDLHAADLKEDQVPKTTQP